VTENQFLKKIKSLHKQNREMIEKKALQLFNCGGVDTTSYKDDYLLPKTILNAVFKYMAWQYQPLNKEDKAISKNLECF